MIRLRLIFLTLFVLIVSQSNAQYNYGLRFKSKEVEKKFRTGLDLTKTGAISFNTSFKISFDLSFRSFDGFGYILRLKDTKTNSQLDLICKFDKVSPGLYLVFNKKEVEKSISLSKINDNLNRWNTATIEYDSHSGRIELTFNNDKISEIITLKGRSSFSLGFGVVNNYGFDTKEVPFISIRSISILTDGTPTHHWELNEQEGNLSKDSISGKVAEITNPEWEIFHHAKWKFINAIKLSEKPKIAYDKKKERIYMVCDHNKIYFYDLKNERFDSIGYAGNPPVNEKDNQFIITDDSRLLVYSQVVDNLSVFDSNKGLWEPQMNMHDSLPVYWHHNKLINPVTQNVTTICGYGFYTYKSNILEYSETEKKWQKINITGDTIYPRYLSALGPNPENKFQYYLFGGLGNKTGDQLLGTRFFYDLYLIDFKLNTIKRVWQLKFNNQHDITPVNSLIVDQDQASFYTLCFAHQDEKSYLKILKASLTSPGYELVGDSIPYYFIDVQSYADLFYWSSSRKMVAITSCQTNENLNEINIYTIQTPPGNLIPINNTLKTQSILSLFQYIFIIISILFITIIIILFRKKIKRNRSENHPIEKAFHDIENDNPIKIETPAPNSINLFGGFQVIDSKGVNITYRFSPTLKELFILILLHSKNNNKGISSVELRETLWPDKQIESANNNRGVNIAKLRSILNDLGNQEIIHENSFWKLKLNEPIFCDYYYVTSLINENEASYFMTSKNLHPLLKHLKRGNILPDIETEWLDKYKSDTENDIVHLLEFLVKHYEMSKEAGEVLEIANTIFLFDQCNETAIKYKCRVLNQLGKHGLAIKTYHDFATKYKSLFGEEFKENFKQLLKD